MLVAMPQFEVTQLARTRELTAMRARCNGCDPARPCDEHARGASIWLVTAGAFQLRDRHGIHALDPTRVLLMPAGHAFVIRHPAGPDTCVSFHGPLVDRLIEHARLAPLASSRAARLASEIAAWRRGEPDELAVAEELIALAGSDEPHVRSKADRAVVSAIAHVLRLDLDRGTSLSEVADRAGYSLFHACRVFRAATGMTIHGFRRELRLRHALARLLDGDEPLAEIADACGFASQSHLTNLFHARFGITPAKARTRDGLARLAA